MAKRAASESKHRRHRKDLETPTFKAQAYPFNAIETDPGSLPSGDSFADVKAMFVSMLDRVSDPMVRVRADIIEHEYKTARQCSEPMSPRDAAMHAVRIADEAIDAMRSFGRDDGATTPMPGEEAGTAPAVEDATTE